MAVYDDERYGNLLETISECVSELVGMEGNTHDLIRSEVENVLDGVFDNHVEEDS